MQMGYESDYPEPSSTYRTPYPAITQETLTSPPNRSPTGNRDVLFTPDFSTPPVRPPAPTYTTLAEYFKLGNIGRNLDPALRQDAANEDIDETDAEPEPQPETQPQHQHRPWTSDFFNSYSGSLPGFHALPETDRLVGASSDNRYGAARYSSTADGQTTTRSETIRGPGRPRASHEPRGTSGRSVGKVRGVRAKGQRRGWKQSIKGTQHEDLFKTPRIPRDPTSRRRGRRPGSGAGAKHVDPGEKFKEFQSLATTAFLEGQYEDAMQHIFEAILANPEVYIAHSLMAQILEKQGRMREAVFAWTQGAFIKRDSTIYTKLAERYLDLEAEDGSDSNINCAIEAYAQAIRLDKNNVEPRKGKLKLHLELNDMRSARIHCRAIVVLQPADLDNVRQYASLCDSSGDASELEKAAEAYETAFQLYANEDSLGDVDDQWDHLNVYLDLMYKINRPQKAIAQLKRLARWFLGRKEDDFWDSITLDDREYDTTHERRAHIWQFQQGRVTRDHLRYGDGLPLELRVKLGLFRLQMGSLHQTETLRHLEHLRRLSNEIDSLSDMFLDVAEALRKQGMYAAAINFYEPIKSLPDLDNDRFWTHFGQCYRELGRNKEAIECFEAAVEASNENIEARLGLVKLYEAAGERVKAFAVATELSEMGRKDLLKREKIHLQKLNPNAKKSKKGKQVQKKKKSARPLRTKDGANTDGFELPTRSRPAPVEGQSDADENDAEEAFVPSTLSLEEQKACVEAAHAKVKELWPSIHMDGDENTSIQWIELASIMAKEFRGTKDFFPDRGRNKIFTGIRTGTKLAGRNMISEMEAIKNRLHKGVANGDDAAAIQSIDKGGLGEFHDIKFEEWHHIFSDLTLLYAKNVDQSQCYDVLKKVLLRANVFNQDPELMKISLAVCISCALIFNDSKLMSDAVRHHDFTGLHGRAMANQLIAATGRLGFGDVYHSDRNTWRWIEAAVTEQDYLAMPPEERAKVDWGKDESRLAKLGKQSEHDKHELDAGMLTMYAHTLARKPGSSDLVLAYLFRALALQPENLVVNLSIGTTFIRNAMQNRSESKQYNIAQGMSFIYRYHDIRVASGKVCHLQEAEYNLARMWHVIGYIHLAVPAYEKVLKLSPQLQEEAKKEGEEEGEVQDFAMEAAFALRMVFLSAGNEAAARAITEEWLVL